jgi:hypothetical protein
MTLQRTQTASQSSVTAKTTWQSTTTSWHFPRRHCHWRSNGRLFAYDYTNIDPPHLGSGKSPEKVHCTELLHILYCFELFERQISLSMKFR